MSLYVQGMTRLSEISLFVIQLSCEKGGNTELAERAARALALKKNQKTENTKLEQCLGYVR